jgi:redox-sensitive bicupin YhaK (pirin superfamily)
MGNAEEVKRGEVQFTSAGTGMRHSEYNASDKDYVSSMPNSCCSLWF